MLASSTAISLSACGSDAALRLAAAEKAKAEAGVVDDALQLQALPDLPSDCRRQEPSGIRAGDRLDTAVVKADAARARANARVVRCAGFYDDVKVGRDAGRN